MASTPEGKVKAEIKKILSKYEKQMDIFWPVPGGYGESHLDCILCVNGHYVCIEVKAPGKKPTSRQRYRINMVQRANGRALVIDGTNATTSYQELDDLLATLTAGGAGAHNAIHTDAR